jgi:integrase
MTLRDLFDTLYRPLRLRGRSPRTAHLYHCLCRSYSRHLGREAALEDLDELRIASYLEARSTQVRPLTCERERNGLNALAGFAFERRLIETKPTVPQGVIPERVPVAWSLDELRRLLAAAADPATYRTGKAGRPPRFRRPPTSAPGPTATAETKARFFSALLPVLWETGERIGAVIEARIEDYQRPHLVVRAEARKGRKRDKCYRLTDATCDRIEQLIAGRTSGPVFAWPMSRTYLWRVFGLAVRAADLDGRHRVRFHQIRRSAASHYAAAGGDACAMLDHSSPRITQRWYLDPRLADRTARPCDVLPPLSPPQADTSDTRVSVA